MQPNLEKQETFIEFLQGELKDRQHRNPRFSLRAYSRVLGISPAMLSQILRGQRVPSMRLAIRMADRTGLQPQKRRNFLKSIAESHGGFTEDPKNANRMELQADQFALVSEWYHFAILSLSEIRPNRLDAHWVSLRLAIPPSTARVALERLLSLKLIERVGRGFRQCQSVEVTSEVVSQAIQHYHRDNLRKADTALSEIPLDEREFSTLTFALRSSDIPKAKRLIRRFQNRICDELEKEDPDRVYTLAVQLFPVSKKLKGDNA